jgi:hypothetical protein
MYITRARTNINPNGTEANSEGRSLRTYNINIYIIHIILKCYLIMKLMN